MESGIRESHRRVSVRVRGIVQGVGFRPYVYRLARQHGLAGWVRNQSQGVELEVAGPGEAVRGFLDRLPRDVPPLARVTACEVHEEPYVSLEGFTILQSQGTRARSTLISPDVCTCGDCLRELFDPQDRRFRYPFINCTHCGPRYTIIQDIPYDRDKTTMAPFTMCPACREEYEDPLNRRFHAQPNACSVCGPRVRLEDNRGSTQADGDDALKRVVDLLAEGAIVAVKGLGGFHLAVSATDERAVRRLRSLKIREEKPFAVLFARLDCVQLHCELNDAEAELLTSPARPIVLLDRKLSALQLPLAQSIAPGNRCLGAFLPYTPLHFLLFDQAPYDALVMTSGNQSDEPIVTSNEEARVRLRSIADHFLLHDREIYLRCDDSVVRVHEGEVRPVRRARGYVPVPIVLREREPAVLGVGAELKNTVCLMRGEEAFVSQHVGDLENLETLQSFEQTIAHLKRILEVEPQCIAHDLHPDYLSTRWGQEQKDVVRLAVQHHHAHIASVAAEHRHAGPILGLALDGTGYGSDGTLWGGELLRVEGHKCERLGHFKPIPLPGGQAAIREPWRMAVAFLWSLEGPGTEEAFEDLVRRFPEKTMRILLQMLSRGVQCPLTSSCGRLFDTVSALIGLRDRITYEGQAAIELEQVMEKAAGRYLGEVVLEGERRVLDPSPMVREVVEDIRRGTRPGIISARFHQGLVDTLFHWVVGASRSTGLETVGLSGGVFQNRVIQGQLAYELKKAGLEVLCHREVPANDACISLGQAHVGAQWLKNLQGMMR